MTPHDGVAAGPQQTWCLADDADESVPLDLLAGDSNPVYCAHCAGPAIRGLWFDPRTGAHHPRPGRGAEIRKPSADAWLLLLSAG